jgi:hypothetical protein
VSDELEPQGIKVKLTPEQIQMAYQVAAARMAKAEQARITGRVILGEAWCTSCGFRRQRTVVRSGNAAATAPIRCTRPRQSRQRSTNISSPKVVRAGARPAATHYGHAAKTQRDTRRSLL